MEAQSKRIKFPENIYLKDLVISDGRSISLLARTIGVSRVTLSNTVHGHYKGQKIIPVLKAVLFQHLKSDI